MPKNKGKGGKGFRKSKHENFNKRPMVYRDKNQAYSRVTKMLGNGRVIVECYIENKKKEIRKHECLGIIRGSMRKRVWINQEDIVLAEIREFQKDKVDIVYKYEPNEVKTLINTNALPENCNITFDSIDIDEKNDTGDSQNNGIDIEFGSNEKETISYQDLINIPSEEEEEEEELSEDSMEYDCYGNNYKKKMNDLDEQFIKDI